MTLVIHDAIIVTEDDEDQVLHRSAIAIEAGRILALGGSDAILAAYPDAERVDAADRAVLPGFANIHTHLGMTLARGVFEDLSPPHKPPFCGGLSPIPLPALSAEENAVMVQLGALEAIRSGTTALLEDGAGIAGYAKPLAATGLRLLLAERAWDRKGAGIGDPGPFVADEALGEAGLERIAALHAAWNGAEGGRIAVGVAAWAPDMCTPALLGKLRTLQQKLDCVCTIHLNQIWGEVAATEAHRGMLPTEYLEKSGFLHDRLIAAHCRCMAHSEERLLGRARSSVAFNSAIAARRGLSPRISVLEAEGCTIGMGTDNMAEDMVEVMRTGLFMERIRREDGRNPTPEQALRWATRNGYRAMGVADGGWLAPGNRADLIMIRTDRAHLVPRLRPVSAFVHQGQASDVESVMVDGRWIMRDGRVLTLDEPAIIREAEAIARRAWAKLFAEHPEIAVPAGFAPPI
ncbi:amidohydrolase family protein [Plastoroseomonas hellenica]|uniref:amidohydrolase family protein n=1 Tax=Plastoroseomonas hellenica TaxID=2687306 RepID=UPI001BAAFE94|nr:amidohydrolase family protein [Plastoroseomonas hellenica]MBR0645836.1 amidohydrolase family protein [Plastoroseomonas hellenica]